MKVYGVIMAGGGGTRFWPLSRQTKPKQLLNLTGKDLMINEAIDRLSFTAPKKDIFIVTNKTQVQPMLQATHGRIFPDHILAEPSGRNTAACIGYAAMQIWKNHGDGIMVVTPSDAFIRETELFTKALEAAVNAAKQNKLVTIGIAPTYPSTAYGYIKYKKEENVQACPVMAFREKPDADTARSYVDSGLYAWNSGMFIWKVSLILQMFQKYLPDIYVNLCKIGEAMGTSDEYNVIEAVYPLIRKISIDYGIMEPCAADGDVLVVPGEFGWNDVGSWDMMDVLHQTDDEGNIAVGDTLSIDTKDTTICASGRLIATVGVENLIIVETKDVVMVCPKERAQDVRLIVEKLQMERRREVL